MTGWWRQSQKDTEPLQGQLVAFETSMIVDK